jgi:hypothetical protein
MLPYEAAMSFPRVRVRVKTKGLYKPVKILFGHYKQQDFVHISVATGAGRCAEPCLEGSTLQG